MTVLLQQLQETNTHDIYFLYFLGRPVTQET